MAMFRVCKSCESKFEAEAISKCQPKLSRWGMKEAKTIEVECVRTRT